MLEQIKTRMLRKAGQLLGSPAALGILSNPQFQEALRRAVNLRADVRENWERQMDQLARAFNLATQAEVQQLQRTIRELEDQVASLDQTFREQRSSGGRGRSSASSGTSKSSGSSRSATSSGSSSSRSGSGSGGRSSSSRSGSRSSSSSRRSSSSRKSSSGSSSSGGSSSGGSSSSRSRPTSRSRRSSGSDSEG